MMCSRGPCRCDVLMMSPRPPDSPADLDHLGQHDVAEGQPEQQPQRVEDAGMRQRNQHLQDHLPPAGAERVGRVDVVVADVRSRRVAVSKMTNATQAMKMNITFCIFADAEQREGQRDQAPPRGCCGRRSSAAGRRR